MDRLFEAAPDAILIESAGGEILRANNRAESLFSYERKDLVGKPVKSLIADQYYRHYCQYRNTYLTQERSPEDVLGIKVLGLRKDGSEFPMEIMLSSISFNGSDILIATVRDISERQIVELAGRKTDELFRLLVTHVKDYAIFMLSPEGVVTTWNDGAERIKGYQSEEIVGKHFSIFYRSDDLLAGKPEEALRHALAQGTYEDTGWRKRKDESLFFANVVYTAIKNDAGELVGYCKVTRDITERMRAEEALKELMQQREDFVATLAHDLKTPVRAANMAIKFMLDGDLGAISEQQEAMLETMLQSNQDMYNLVVTLLDVYRYDSGNKQLNMLLNDLSPAIHNLVEELRPFAKSRQISIDLLLPQKAAPVICDIDEIRRVMQNLLDNAIKYTPPGGLVSVQLQQSLDATTVLIRDNGNGIPPEEQAVLFERFRAPAASGRDYASTGLGLYLCRKIVEFHGGSIACESKPLSGSTFSFVLKNAS
jgi:PAS domain S-box-containing protein